MTEAWTQRQIYIQTDTDRDINRICELSWGTIVQSLGHDTIQGAYNCRVRYGVDYYYKWTIFDDQILAKVSGEFTESLRSNGFLRDSILFMVYLATFPRAGTT
jgi:hypothetical protein